LCGILYPDWIPSSDPTENNVSHLATSHTESDAFSQVNTLHYGTLPSYHCPQLYAIEPAEYESRVKTAARRAKRWIERFLNAATDANPHVFLRNAIADTFLHEHQEAQLKGWIRKLGTWGCPVRVNLLQRMVNSIADSPPGQRPEAGKNWPAVSIPNDPANWQ